MFLYPNLFLKIDRPFLFIFPLSAFLVLSETPVDSEGNREPRNAKNFFFKKWIAFLSPWRDKAIPWWVLNWCKGSTQTWLCGKHLLLFQHVAGFDSKGKRRKINHMSWQSKHLFNALLITGAKKGGSEVDILALNYWPFFHFHRCLDLELLLGGFK